MITNAITKEPRVYALVFDDQFNVIVGKKNERAYFVSKEIGQGQSKKRVPPTDHGNLLQSIPLNGGKQWCLPGGGLGRQNALTLSNKNFFDKRPDDHSLTRDEKANIESIIQKARDEFYEETGYASVLDEHKFIFSFSLFGEEYIDHRNNSSTYFYGVYFKLSGVTIDEVVHDISKNLLDAKTLVQDIMNDHGQITEDSVSNIVNNKFSTSQQTLPLDNELEICVKAPMNKLISQKFGYFNKSDQATGWFYSIADSFIKRSSSANLPSSSGASTSSNPHPTSTP